MFELAFEIPADNWQLTLTTSLPERFLDGLAERFSVDPAGGFFGSDFHDRTHLGFGCRSGLGDRILDQLTNFILSQAASGDMPL